MDYCILSDHANSLPDYPRVQTEVDIKNLQTACQTIPQSKLKLARQTIRKL